MVFYILIGKNQISWIGGQTLPIVKRGCVGMQQPQSRPLLGDSVSSTTSPNARHNNPVTVLTQQQVRFYRNVFACYLMLLYIISLWVLSIKDTIRHSKSFHPCLMQANNKDVMIHCVTLCLTVFLLESTLCISPSKLKYLYSYFI